jgi:hypothetical protein
MTDWNVYHVDRMAEDLCMQLLVLKILYLLFTTKGTSEYFYTNDLCVLVDVFLRELVDMDEDSESARAVHIIIFITSADLPIAPPHIPTCSAPFAHQNTTSRHPI